MKTLILTLITVICLASCAAKRIVKEEDLFKINPNDRIIVGYSKNMKWYKVVDQYDRKRTDIRIDSIVRPIGGAFIAKERNIYSRY